MPRMTQAEVDAYEARQSFKKWNAKVETVVDANEREADLHNQILDECRRRGWIPLHGSMASPTKRTEGEPDFVILANRRPVGHLHREYFAITYLVEGKSRTGKLSPAQQAFHAHAATLGHKVHVVRSFQEFLAVTGAVEMAQEGEK